MSTIRELLRFGSRNTAVALCGTLSLSVDAAVIGFLLPLQAVTQYAIGARLCGFLRTLALKPIDVAMSAYSHADSLCDRAQMLRILTRTTGLAYAVAIPGAVCLFAFGENLIRHWVGECNPSTLLTVLLLSSALLLQLPGHTCYTILTASERNHMIIRVCMVSALLNVSLSILFTRLIGAAGPALATLVSVACVDCLLLPRILCAQFGFSGGDLARRVLSPLVIPTLCALMVAWGLTRVAHSESILFLLCQLALVTVAFGIPWAFSSLNEWKPGWRHRLDGAWSRMAAWLPIAGGG